MSKTSKRASNFALTTLRVDPEECPFREFRDSELLNEYWGLDSVKFKNLMISQYTATDKKKINPDQMGEWEDDQIQPLPRSVVKYLHSWEKAEDLARTRWGAEVTIFDENHLNTAEKMSVSNYQLAYPQVLMRSQFCRNVFAACFALELNEFIVEHQWDNFSFVFGPEGWRPRYHIYSPGMKPGGGVQHRPMISKSGCYLVRLFYLGAWRCVWVSDYVPVDASGAPLLPFSPLAGQQPVSTNVVKKTTSTTMTAMSIIHLWPLLLCKALLKLAAPDMDDLLRPESDEMSYEDELFYSTSCEDDRFPEFHMLQALTGGFSVIYAGLNSADLWSVLCVDVKQFAWDDEDENVSSTAKAKSAKKPNPKEKEANKKLSLSVLMLYDTGDKPPYAIPNITPAYESMFNLSMIRDIPLKKPPTEPVITEWKTYRWLEWARRHGLYEQYDCPRTKYLKINGFLKLSCMPHLINIDSSESITTHFVEEHGRADKSRKTEVKKEPKDVKQKEEAQELLKMQKADLREWVLYDSIFEFIIYVNFIYFPSAHNFASASSHPFNRINKTPMPNIDVQIPKCAPLYLQIDSGEDITFKVSLSMLHPKILSNCNHVIHDYVENAHLLLECYDWFVKEDLPLPFAYLQTREYDSVDMKLPPGRHVLRLWVHSRLSCHVQVLSVSTIELGSREVMMAASCHECPWVEKFLTPLCTAFSNFIKSPKSTMKAVKTDSSTAIDRDIFSCYQPDLPWDPQLAGYDIHFIHWMFNQALQSLLHKRIHNEDQLNSVFEAMRHLLRDPNFGFPPKPLPPRYKEMQDKDPCDCVHLKYEQSSGETVLNEQDLCNRKKYKSILMEKMWDEPGHPATSQVCELADDVVSCSEMREERVELIRKHDAATLIQANWRGFYARQIVHNAPIITAEVIKLLMEIVFGHNEGAAALMNEFFHLFPGTKHAYSIASGLTGYNGFSQYPGISPVSSKCTWIPFFHAQFNCHAPVKVHLSICTLLENTLIRVYDNDTKNQLPQVYNAHLFVDVHPNTNGYTVIGQGILPHPQGYSSDLHWELNVLSSLDNKFHICSTDSENTPSLCTLQPLFPSVKFRIEELYIPNRRNILGMIVIHVSAQEVISFRAAASTPGLEMEAVLRSVEPDGTLVELNRCYGIGQVYWPFLNLQPVVNGSNAAVKSSRSLFNVASKLKAKKTLGKHSEVFRPSFLPTDPTKQYFIEITAPKSWALPIVNWVTINQIIQEVEVPKIETATKNKPSSKPSSAKGQPKVDSELTDPLSLITPHVVRSEDAYVEIECATNGYGTAFARRDDERELKYLAELKSWEQRELGRNARGAVIRELFRDEFLIHKSRPVTEEIGPEEEMTVNPEDQQSGSSRVKFVSKSKVPPGTRSDSTGSIMTLQDNKLYYTMPEELMDKYLPLLYVPQCTRQYSTEYEHEPTWVTPGMAEAAMNERMMHKEAALAHLQQLEDFYDEHVKGKQTFRIDALDERLVDSSWSPELAYVMDQRNESLKEELLERQLSAARKKELLKAKEVKPKDPKKK